MPINPVGKYFAEYIEAELSDAEMIKFHNLLAQDSTFADHLDKFYQIHHQLKQYRRSQPDQILFHEYHANLKRQFYPSISVRRNVAHRLSIIIKNLIHTKSLWVRTVEAFALVLIGIMLGWILFYGGDDNGVTVDRSSEYFSNPITDDDRNYIYYYFQASEIVLLEIDNMNEAQFKEGYDIYLNKEIATKLLKKTFFVHDKALQLNDIRILRFLGKMEIIMYELSNMHEGEVDEALEAVRMVIRDADLLEEAKRLQVVMEKARSSAG